MGLDWRWDVFLEPLPHGGGTYLDWLLDGLRTTLGLFVASWVLALALGTAVGVLRTVPSRTARVAATIWVELFRNVPLLVQLFVWYYVVPEVVPAPVGAWIKSQDPLRELFLASTLCLGTFTSARIAEQVRAGIEALARGQKAAALALGMTLPQAYRHVLLPMAFRLVVPPLGSEAANLVKNSAVASTLGLLELAAQGRQILEYTARAYESFTAVTLAYLAVNAVVLLGARWLERWARVPGFLGGGR